MGLRKRVADERRFISEDAGKAKKAIARRRGTLMTGPRKSGVGMVVGTVAVTVGLAQWAVPAAWIFVGVALLVYGLVIVDVDETGTRRRRRPRG